MFDKVVSFLLALAAATLLVQPRISRWRADRRGRSDRYLFPIGLFVCSVDSGSFGAGAGVMVLALVLLTVNQHLARANALKNMLLGMADVAAGIGFALFGPVHWTALVPLALGDLVGSMLGPSLTRRVPGTLLRTVVAGTGFGLAVWLWIRPSG